MQPSDSDNIKVVVHKKLYANNQSDGDKYNQGSRPIITVNGTSVLLKQHQRRRRPRRHYRHGRLCPAQGCT